MKLITFTTAGFSRIGALVDGEKVVDLNYAYQAQLQSEGKYRYEAIAEAYIPAKMEGFLEGGQESMELAKSAIDYALGQPDSFKHQLVYEKSEVKVEAPVTQSWKDILCRPQLSRAYFGNGS